MKTSKGERRLLDVRRALVDGQFASAESMLNDLFARTNVEAEVYMLAGRLAAARRDPARELQMMQAAVERQPSDGEYLALLGRCYVRAQDIDAALACVEAALACSPLSDLAYDALASILAQLGRHGDAAELLRRATTAGSRNAAVYFNLGNNLKFTGDFAGARAAFEQALVLAPQYHKAHAALTSLGGISADSNHLPRLETLIRQTDDPRTAIHLRHAAAKECEALSRFDEAWHHLATGKLDLLSVTGTDPQVAISAMDQLAAIARDWSPDSDRTGGDGGPIFIVGMPRSGTTVLDRIISNHRDVTSIGESLYFAQQLKAACGSTSRNLLDTETLGALVGGVDLAQIGARYMAHAAEVSRGSPRFVDKFHLNFMLSGHLMRAMPQARILCVVRDPLDTIVSNFRQLFEFESTLYAYSLNIVAATEFYIRFRRLAALWESLTPERFRTVRYETLVADPEAETASLLSFCDLEWQDGCSAIERNSASVATASAVQVRSKIHTGSIGNWRRYERHLHGVRRRLAEEGLLAPDGASVADGGASVSR
jgi:tetratricopeptide (TPR) repeat protein